MADGFGFIWDTSIGSYWTADPNGNAITTAWTNSAPPSNAVLGTGPGNGSGTYTASILFSDIKVGTISTQNGNWTINLGGTNNLTFDSSIDSVLGATLAGSGSVTKDGTNTLTIATTSNFSGGTTVNNGFMRLVGLVNNMGPVLVNTGGTLQIGASDTLSSGTALTLAGGKLQIFSGAFSQSFSSTPLALNASSIIDFGTGLGASAITFGDSSGQSWTGTLTISNFAAGDTLRFGSSSLALSGSQLLAIKFDGVDAQIDASGFVTPVPEPSSYAACAGLLTCAACALRRRRRALALSGN